MPSDPHQAPVVRRIVFASHTADLSGAERGLVELATGLASRGHAVTVLVPKQGPLLELLDAAGLPWEMADYRWWARLHRRWLRRVRHLVRQLQRRGPLKRILARLEPDVVITNTLVVPAPALAARALGIPHVWYIREFGTLDHRLHFDLGIPLSARLVDHLSDAVIVNCKALADYFERWIERSKLTVVYNAVELGVDEATLNAWRAERPDDGGPLRCVLLGKIRPSKGQLDAVRAVARLRDAGTPVALAIVGDGQPADERALDALIDELDVGEQVERVGFSTEPLRHFCRADVALVCSTHEAFGRVVVEAQKVGCPVIVAESGGIVEHVRPGVDGYTYPPGDVEALAERIERLARDPDRRLAFGRAARARADATYRLDRQVPEVEAVIESVIGGRA